MKNFKSKEIFCLLVLTALFLAPAGASAQGSSAISITVEDGHGAAISGASILDSAGKLIARTDASGQARVPCTIPCTVSVSAKGFSAKSAQLSAATVIPLTPAADSEQVVVSAYRTPISVLDSPVATRQLPQVALDTTAAVTLDGELRQLPGVELFRRSSSLVANPSSQGISLRALGSTSASRTLVTEDDVPLNDAFAGTIHWLEQPELAIQSIELMRGGASDLYGSSAIGGVVSIIPVRPSSDGVELRSSFGAEGTYDDSLLAEAKRGPWGLLASGGGLATDGFIQEAPSQRGPVDIRSNVHSQNAMLLAEHDSGQLRLMLRGSGFNEARNNGTPYQTNGTRLWRYATGADWQAPHNATLVYAFLRIDRSLPPDLLKHLQCSERCQSLLLLSLWRDTNQVFPDARQRTRRSCPLEPAARCGPSARRRRRFTRRPRLGSGTEFRQFCRNHQPP
jgi:hypothetical protein